MPNDDPPPGAAETTPGNQRGRPWPKGVSGNPAGRPLGSRHEALKVLDAIGAEGAREVMQAVVDAAKGGDMRAADILLKRLWPERKGRPVPFALPELRTSADAVEAAGAVAQAVAAGELTPEEGQAVAAVVEMHRRAVETVEFDARIRALEFSILGREPNEHNPTAIPQSSKSRTP